MAIKTIPLSRLETGLHEFLNDCADSGSTLVVELPDHRFVSIQPVDEDDDLINELIKESPAFRELLARSKASPRKPFVFEN